MSTVQTESRPAQGEKSVEVSKPAVNAKQAALALYLIAFVSGAILMGIEIAGSRILAPGFGTSIFVWGSLIGLFMGAMALGYWIGGTAADRLPSFKLMATVVSMAGVWIMFIPYFGPSICENIARNVTHRMWGPLLASTALFAAPIFLMAMVTPYCIKLRTTSLAGLGVVAGRLTALSTFGSIVGTLGTTFFLIPYFRVSNVLMGLSVALVVTAIVSYVVFKQAFGKWDNDDKAGTGILALVALALLEACVLVPVKPLVAVGNRQIHYVESEYHDIAVTEDILDTHGQFFAPESVRRWLKFNENIESATYPFERKHMNAVSYTNQLHLPLIWVPEPKLVLVVGGGGGILPAQYFLHYPSIVRVDVLELDAHVEHTARDYFQVPETKKINFIIGDARRNLKDLKEHYDVILLDAYSSGGQIPFHLMTWEFLREARERLTPNGVLATNIISAIQNLEFGERSADLFLAEYKTLLASEAEAQDKGDTKPLFPTVYVFPKIYEGQPMHGKEHHYRNVIVVATRETQPLSYEEVATRAKMLTRGSDAKIKINRASFVWNAERLYQRKPSEAELRDIPLLTDQHAPVDTMYRPVKREEWLESLY